MARKNAVNEPVAPAPVVEVPKATTAYVTLDGNEALKYTQVGGRLVSITRQYPNNPFKSGKRYVFLETKDALDALLARSEES